MDVGSLHVFGLSATLKNTDSVLTLFHSYHGHHLTPQKCGLVFTLEIQKMFNVDPAHSVPCPGLIFSVQST